MYNKKDWLENQEKTEKDIVKYESEWMENEIYIEGNGFPRLVQSTKDVEDEI